MISTTEHCHPTESVGLTGGSSLTELQRLRPHYCGKRRNLRVFRGRMLLLCKPVRDSERECTPIAREDQDKGKKKGNILEYRMEELGPKGSPHWQAHLLCSLCYYS
jgi:hypothetical protein